MNKTIFIVLVFSFLTMFTDNAYARGRKVSDFDEKAGSDSLKVERNNSLGLNLGSYGIGFSFKHKFNDYLGAVATAGMFPDFGYRDHYDKDMYTANIEGTIAPKMYTILRPYGYCGLQYLYEKSGGTDDSGFYHPTKEENNYYMNLGIGIELIFKNITLDISGGKAVASFGDDRRDITNINLALYLTL